MPIEDENRFDVSRWNGQNLLGQILMEVRDELRRAKNNGNLGYVDVYKQEFPLWKMTPGE